MQASCVTSPLPLLALQNQVGLFPYEQLGGETKEKDKSVEIQQQEKKNQAADGSNARKITSSSSSLCFLMPRTVYFLPTVLGY